MTITDGYYLIEGINPEPWTAPSAYAGRRGGKAFAGVSKNAALTAYQAAIAESIDQLLPADYVTPTHDVGLSIWFWRQLVTYQSDSGRNVTKHRADLSNMVKALEDSLQPHKSRPEMRALIANDRQVVTLHSTIVSQSKETEPMILIHLHGTDEYSNIHAAGMARRLRAGRAAA